MLALAHALTGANPVSWSMVRRVTGGVVARRSRGAGARVAGGLPAADPMAVCLVAGLGGKAKLFGETSLVKASGYVADYGDNNTESDAERHCHEGH